MTIRIVRIGLGGDGSENPLAAIDHFHWEEDGTDYAGIYDRLEMFEFLRSKGEAYILDKAWRRVLLRPAVTVGGIKYVRTVENGREDLDLLAMPLCVD